MNIISRQCEFLWDVRVIPGENALSVFEEFQAFCQDIILPKMRAVHQDANIHTTILADTPPLQEVADSPALKLAQDLAGNNVRSRGLMPQRPVNFRKQDFPPSFVALDQLSRRTNQMNILNSLN